MAMYYLENDKLRVAVDSFGAELKSIQNKEKQNQEYMWCADPAYWKRTSPVLFPIVGSLKNQSYTYDGKTYQMSQHGFARDMEFTIEKQSREEVIFILRDTEQTWAKYPFAFALRIGYVLQGDTVIVRWNVENTGNKDMYFSIGGHPAFNCPIQGQGKQIDYTLSFDTQDEVISSVIGEGGLVSTQKKRYELSQGVLPITEDLFDQDALVIEKNQAHKVALRDGSGHPYVTVSFDAPLFGIWSPTGKQAPFICIEPWYGRCDSKEFMGTLQEREWGNHLQPEEQFNVSYQIQLA